MAVDVFVSLQVHEPRNFADDPFVKLVTDELLGAQGRLPRQNKTSQTVTRLQREHQECRSWLLNGIAGIMAARDQRGVLHKSGHGKRLIQAARKRYCPADLEPETAEFLQRCASADGVYRLPLYANTLKQWTADIQHDTTRTDRAQDRARQVLATNQKGSGGSQSKASNDPGRAARAKKPGFHSLYWFRLVSRPACFP